MTNSVYIDDYFIMAYRIFINKIDWETERSLRSIVYNLMDLYTDVEIHDYVFHNKIL